MAVDTPARIVVIGAGPIGLEAALYARYLGYDVDLLEQGEIGEHIRKWGHVRMFSRWRELASPLGLAALQGQFPDWKTPAADERPTGREWLQQYLEPLAQTDLIADNIQTGTRVVAVSRSEWLKTDCDIDRRDWTLRVLAQNRDDIEVAIDADVVIDSSGLLSQPNACGPGGAPAIGERSVAQQIRRVLPDIAGSERSSFAGKDVLVVGGGASAATAVVELVQLAEDDPNTRVTWLLRRTRDQAERFPWASACDQRPAVAQLARRVRELLSKPPSCLDIRLETWVESVRREGNRWVVETGGENAPSWEGDAVIALVGYRPDVELFRELQVELTCDTESPVGMTPARQHADEQPLAESGLRAENGLNEWLSTGEPDFYVLGSKSFGRAGGYFHEDGLRQIRALFARLADRAGLDLYQTQTTSWGEAAS